MFHTVYLLDQYPGLTYLELKSLATHCLNKYREMKNTAAVDHEGVGRIGFLDPHRQVLFSLPEEPLPELP